MAVGNNYTQKQVDLQEVFFVEHAERLASLELGQKNIEGDISEIKGNVKEILKVINNGLSTQAKSNTKKIDDHLLEHKEKIKNRKATWIVPLISSVMGGIITFLCVLILFKLGVK